MELTEEYIKDTISDFFGKCQQHSLIGIRACDVFDGTPLPKGWWLHPDTEWYLPPNYIDLPVHNKGNEK